MIIPINNKSLLHEGDHQSFYTGTTNLRSVSCTNTFIPFVADGTFNLELFKRGFVLLLYFLCRIFFYMLHLSFVLLSFFLFFDE